MPPPAHILTINSGSSSVKFSLYETGDRQARVLSGALERIGLSAGLFHARGASGETLIEEHPPLPDHDSALEILLQWLPRHAPNDLAAVGHRLVYGGREHTKPACVTPELVAALHKLIPFAPEHLPHELKAIQAVARAHPGLKQVACFDTAFHSGLPEIAKMVPLPRSFFHEGVMRYGFHGLSYEYILGELAKEAGAAVARGRVIMAHLGNGASLAAVKEGKPVDTTMGLTPAGGLMMGTRSGDLDPGVMLYLLEEKKLSPAMAREIVNRQSGLLGVSGISSDMRDLLSKEAGDPRAAEAIALYCYQARKFLGAFIGVLGGVDTLVFTAGIGENAPAIRRRICEGLEFFGIRLDEQRNQANASVISGNDSAVTVRVIKTDEEGMIARHTSDLLSLAPPVNP